MPSDGHLVNVPMSYAGGHFATVQPGFYGLPAVIRSRPDDPAETLDAIAEHDDDVKDGEPGEMLFRGDAFGPGHLAGYKVPKQVLLVDLLPRTAVGKVAVGQVKEMCAEAAVVGVTG